MAETQWEEKKVKVGDDELTVIEGGAGSPLIVLHEELGHPGITNWHNELARDHTVMIPLYPGFGQTERVGWVSNIRDLAGLYSRVLREQNLAPANVIGFSLGGWIAAEMAACNAAQFRRMVLVAPFGIRPPEGYIADMFQVTAKAYLDASVQDIEGTPEFAKLYGGEPTPEQFEAWEDARAESARIAWAPYMFNPSLGPLLECGGEVKTLIIWGQDDQIAPVSAAAVYQQSIAGSELLVLEGCGHRPEVEQAETFVEKVRSFLA